MDLLIITMGAAFLGLIGAGVFLLLKEPIFQNNPCAPRIPAAGSEARDPAIALQKKMTQCEGRINTLEIQLKDAQEQLQDALKRQDELTQEKINNTVNSENFERLKNEHGTLRQELTKKEETLENEISERRRLRAEVTRLQDEETVLKKKVSETEDALRKAQAIIENLLKEQKSAKAALEEQNKLIQEHTINKTDGQWVSREEFQRLEAALREKDNLLAKMQSQK